MTLDFVASSITTSLSANTNKYYLLTIGDTLHPHMAFLSSSTPGIIFKIFEGPTISANGTSVTIIAQYRDTDTLLTPTISIYEDPTVTDDGTLLYSEQIGSTTIGGRIGVMSASERSELEFALKKSTNYLLKLTALANNTDISSSFRWVEALY